MKSFRRRGITLVETLVALCVGSMLVGVVWGIFGVGIRSFQRSERVSGAQLSALLAVETVESDLLSAFIDRENVDRPVSVDHGGKRLAFHRARSDRGDLLRVYDETCIFEIPSTARGPGLPLLRNGKPVTGVRLRDGSFEFLPAGEGNREVHFVRMRLTCCDEAGQGAFSMVRLFALEAPTRLWQKVKGGRP